MPIKQDDQEKIIQEVARTGLKGKKLLSLVSSAPKTMTSKKVNSILSGQVESAPEKWISLLLETFEKQPGILFKSEPISAEDIARLKKEAERTGMSGASIFSKLENIPKGLAKHQVVDIVRGRSQSALIGLLSELFDAYSRQPDQNSKKAMLKTPETFSIQDISPENE